MFIKTMTLTYTPEDLARPQQNDPFTFSTVVKHTIDGMQPTAAAVKYFEDVIGLERENVFAMCNMIMTEDFEAMLEHGYEIAVSYQSFLDPEKA